MCGSEITSFHPLLIQLSITSQLFIKHLLLGVQREEKRVHRKFWPHLYVAYGVLGEGQDKNTKHSSERNIRNEMYRQIDGAARFPCHFASLF